MKKMLIVFCLVLSVLITCSCDTGRNDPQQDEYPKKSIELIAPAGTGSGYDLTIRSVARCLQETKLTTVPLPVTNKPGNGGVIALEYLAQKRGADDVLAVYSPPLCLINLNGSTTLSYIENTTPIAMLIFTCGLFAVGKDSPYQTINDVMEALKRDPKSVKVGGISSPRSMDHIQFLKMARAAGVTRLDEIEYVGYQDGTAAAQLMGGHVDLISTGISDSIGLVENGDIRALAITSDKRVGEGIVAQIPTCREMGIDATFFNWRGIFGPKDMPEYARKYWEEILERMAESEEWKAACKNYGWDMTFYNSAEFSTFLEEMNAEYTVLLRDIGMAG